MPVLHRIPWNMTVRPVRYLCWWRNAMARRSDRVESAAAACLLVMFLISLPLAAWAGQSMYAGAAAHAREVRTSGHYANAVLLENAPTAAGTDGTTADAWVKARWYGPKNQVHVDQVQATPGARAGALVPVWINRQGQQTEPPASMATIVANATAFGLTIALGAGCLLEAARRIIRWELNRTRLMGWEEEWRSVGPRWTRPAR